MNVFTKSVALLSLVILPFVSFSQSFWEGSFSIGYTNYLGDLVEPVMTFKEAHPGISASIRHYFDENHAIRLNFVQGKISGNDLNFEKLAFRGNSFETMITELSLLGELDLTGNKRFTLRGGYKKMMSPYLFAGIGIVFADPEVTYGEPGNSDELTDYPKTHITIPMGFGLKKDLNPQLYMGMEWGLRFALSDNLDGTQLTGHAYSNDVYIFGGITLGCRFIPKTLFQSGNFIEQK